MWCTLLGGKPRLVKSAERAETACKGEFRREAKVGRGGEAKEECGGRPEKGAEGTACLPGSSVALVIMGNKGSLRDPPRLLEWDTAVEAVQHDGVVGGRPGVLVRLLLDDRLELLHAP